MKKLFALLVLFVSSVYSQGVDDFKNGIDFIGTGTEPFWCVKVDIEKGIFFESPGKELKIETGIPKATSISDKEGTIYSAEAKKYELKVQIIKGTCSDGMSDNAYAYSVKVFITETGKDTKELSGCGNYTFDNRLDDIWALDKFKGSEIKREQYSKTKPYIEIKINDNRIGGNTGCNDFFGAAEIKGDKIVIKNETTMTKMACFDIMDFESEFIQAIKGKTYYYKIEDLKLFFIENEKVIMEFHKID
jgi:heat shock protein HslJ